MMARGRLRSALGRLALLTGSLGLGFVVCELAARVYEGYPILPLVPAEPYVDNALMYRENSSRGYELRPGLDQVVGAMPVRIRINSAGFRDDRDPPEEKPQGTFRIVMLGDSFGFSGKVPLDETMPVVLAKRLSEASAGTRFEALNFSVPGYNTEQEQLLLEERGMRYRPDVVLVAFVLNDAVPGWQPLAKRPRFPLAIRRVLKRSYLVQFVYTRIRRLEGKKGGPRTRESPDMVGLAAGRPEWQRVRDSLARMKETADTGGARLVVVIWPMLEGLASGYPFREKHELVANACRELGIGVVDLLPTFAGREEDQLWVAPYDHHPNVLANALAAQAVFSAWATVAREGL
jgi:hypothetical protein